MRSPIGGSGIPNGACSPSNQPAPRPRTNRPPVTWSRTVAAFATRTGWRNVFESTACPTRMPGTWWTSAASVVTASSDAPGVSGSMSVRWSFIHAPSHPPSSPASRHVASSVAQFTRCGDVLNEIRSGIGSSSGGDHRGVSRRTGLRVDPGALDGGA